MRYTCMASSSGSQAVVPAAIGARCLTWEPLSVGVTHFVTRLLASRCRERLLRRSSAADDMINLRRLMQNSGYC
jgi:hypothetical protein